MLASLRSLARCFAQKKKTHTALFGFKLPPQAPPADTRRPRPQSPEPQKKPPAQKEQEPLKELEMEEPEQRRVRRSLFLLQHWPNEQAAMRLFRDMLRSRSSRGNLEVGKAAVAAVCSHPESLQSPLVPLYILDQALSKQFPLPQAHLQALVVRTTAIWPKVGRYRAYFRLAAQLLGAVEALRSQALLDEQPLRDFFSANTPQLAVQLSSPLLDSQAQVLRSLLALDSARTLDRGLLSQLLAHLHARLDFLDLADLAVLADCLALAQAAGPPEAPLAAQLEETLVALAARLERRPALPSQGAFFAALRLSQRGAAGLPARLRHAIDPLLQARHFLETPDPEGSGFAGFFRAAQEDLTLDGLAPEARPAFARLLGDMTLQAGLGWYKRLEPVLRVVLWRERRLGLRSLVAAPELKLELRALLSATDAPALQTPAGPVERLRLARAVDSALGRPQQPLDLGELIAQGLQQPQTPLLN